MRAGELTAQLNWPLPFHFRIEEEMEGLESEPCLILFRDGKELLGDLVRFAPEEGFLELLSDGESSSTIKMQKVDQIRLLRQVNLGKNPDLPGDDGESVFHPPERQHFRVSFASGKEISGETLGFSTGKYGLYLYLVNEGGAVTRSFIPSQAMESYQIGDAIGQMLIDEQVVTENDVQAGLDEQQKLRSQRIGDYLTGEQIVTPEQLVTALKKQQAGSNLRLGDALIQERLITPEQLEEALSRQRNDRKKALGEILVGMGIVDQSTVRRILAKKLGIPFVDVRKFRVDPNTIQLVPLNFAAKHTILPLYKTDKTLIVAMEDPMNWVPLDELRFLVNLNIAPVMALKEDILVSIDQYYKAKGGGQRIGDLASELINEEEAEEAAAEEAVAESDNTLVRLVNKMIMDAYHQGASDIHIESYPGKRSTRVRFRKDGSLVDYFEFPPNFRNALVSRIKIMARLNISEKRRPQDGKIEIVQQTGGKVELRVATIPTSGGLEDIVLRVLAAAEAIPIENLDLAPDVLEKVKRLVVKPYGLFLICGPTGSGKTTTLHSVLGYINTDDRKIWTAEDPVEITQEGLRQVQVNPNIGWTFAAAMRSFLRADPDVIMVGEMRDTETAKIGIEASLTGHLVFSTLHTNSAPESMVRLLDLGMDPFNFSDALLGVVAQRLAKRCCGYCKKPYSASREEVEELLQEYCIGTKLDPREVHQRWRRTYLNSKGEFMLSAATGCPECNGTGYKGRIGLHEFLEATPIIKKLIQRRANVDELFDTAIGQGMRTLKQDGIEKILQGHTDIHQIRSVCS